MNRKEKIELLNGIANSTRQIKELSIIHDPIIIDKNDSRPIITAAKDNGNRIILSENLERLEADGMLKGFVIDVREGIFKLLSYN